MERVCEYCGGPIPAGRRGEQHAKGIGWLLSSDKLPDFIEVLKKMGMYEKFREEDNAA